MRWLLLWESKNSEYWSWVYSLFVSDSKYQNRIQNPIGQKETLGCFSKCGSGHIIISLALRKISVKCTLSHKRLRLKQKIIWFFLNGHMSIKQLLISVIHVCLYSLHLLLSHFGRNTSLTWYILKFLNPNKTYILFLSGWFVYYCCQL